MMMVKFVDWSRARAYEMSKFVCDDGSCVNVIHNSCAHMKMENKQDEKEWAAEWKEKRKILRLQFI